MQTAKSSLARRSVTLTLCQDRFGVDHDKEVGRAVPLVLGVVAVSLSGFRHDGHAHRADELDRTFIEADHRSLGIMRLGIEIEEILHAGDVFAIDLGDAPRLLLPGLQSTPPIAARRRAYRQTEEPSLHSRPRRNSAREITKLSGPAWGRHLLKRWRHCLKRGLTP